MMSNVFGAVEWSRIEGGGGVGGHIRDHRMLSCRNLVYQLSQNFHTSFFKMLLFQKFQKI